MDRFVRRTTTDAVYEELHDDIVSLKVLPGTKLSETEVARRFGVSRQPVRNAFTKLGNQDLLLVRPQKATVVRGFSMDRIALARLVRLAVELEVTRAAVEVWTPEKQTQLEENLQRQEDAITSNNMPDFHALDYEFHRLICDLSGNPLAFDVVRDSKKKVDRLCVLSLTHDREAPLVLADHRAIAAGLEAENLDATLKVVRKHLRRLDATIMSIHDAHPDYFE